ncbi:hypothetical protein AVEN_153546-1 [Araneus ventricosus]|uniref:Tc1-like transposase DDE domain-containing protein n=1 Tax=Araneus ventricosus TaxID=182803 RepID=A0A4Y2G5P3_ARAVE|nr:hypothetical protein AVEN_153546-1 [Araneus ventricosus]
MLEMYAVPQMQQHQPDVIFQQDGTPPHWGMIVRDFLDENFPDRWCGRGGPIPWPPRSPDITPLDFFLWGFVKNIVYKTPVPSLDELKRRIVTAIQKCYPTNAGEHLEGNRISSRCVTSHEGQPCANSLIFLISLIKFFEL